MLISRECYFAAVNSESWDMHACRTVCGIQHRLPSKHAGNSLSPSHFLRICIDGIGFFLSPIFVATCCEYWVLVKSQILPGSYVGCTSSKHCERKVYIHRCVMAFHHVFIVSAKQTLNRTAVTHIPVHTVHSHQFIMFPPPNVNSLFMTSDEDE